MSAFAKDVTDATFQQEVIEASKKTPVLVDFWAPWCGPCRVLKPVLEKIAEQYEGKFLLAKVNSDENPGVSRQYGIRSIPNVKAFVDGSMVDEFLGALPESQVRAFVDGLIPSPGELLRQQALQAKDEGDKRRALELLNQAALMEPKYDAIHADRADLQLELGDIEAAKESINRLSPLANEDGRISAIIARVGFALGGTNGEDALALRQRIEINPNDLDARLKLANQHVLREEFEPALDQLIEIVKRDRKFGDDIGRKTILSVFNLITHRDDLIRRYRQLLASAIH